MFTFTLFLSAERTHNGWRRDISGQRDRASLNCQLQLRAESFVWHTQGVFQCCLGQHRGFVFPWFGSLHLEKAMVPGWQTSQHKCANHILAEGPLCWLASEKWYTRRPPRQITTIYSLWKFWNLNLEQVHCFLFLLEIDQRTCWSLFTLPNSHHAVLFVKLLGSFVGWA